MGEGVLTGEDKLERVEEPTWNFRLLITCACATVCCRGVDVFDEQSKVGMDDERLGSSGHRWAFKWGSR